MVKLGEAKAPTDTRLYAVGDVHGCLGELNLLIDRIFDDLDKRPVPSHQIIFLGDYVDRGPDSAGTFDRLINLKNSHKEVICLKGNHEDKLIEFLDQPVELAHSFLKYGGDALARSYGITPPTMGSDDETVMMFRDQLRAAIPQTHIDFVDQLALKHEAGDYFFAHAGVRPGVPLANQDDHDLMWIRSDFIGYEEPFEKVIVHGHTPQDMPEIKPNRINVDTCAYGTGCLTAVVLEGTDYHFLNTA